MMDLTVSKGIYNLGRVYPLLKKQDKLTGEQALLLDKLKSFRAKIIEIDTQLHGVFRLGYEIQRSGRV